MKLYSKTSIFTVAFLMAAFLFPMLSANVAHGGIMPSLETGCCTTEKGGGMCIGCPEGETCITSGSFCDEQGGILFIEGACLDDGQGATCENRVQRTGCCMIEPGSCADDINFETCFFENSPTPELWISGLSCSEVVECTPTRNIPTLSNWALIVTAGILVLVGIWGITRKKAEV